LLQEADALARRVRFEMARELRDERVDAGISLRTAAARAAMSHVHLARMERGEVRALTVRQLSRACAAVGLQLWVRAMPGTGTPLDAGQLALIGRLRAVLPPSVRVRTEVPIPIPGDRRAWDVVLGLDPDDTPLETEARLRDIQALERRCALKLRDSEFDRLILLVGDTLNNRRVLDSYREDLRAASHSTRGRCWRHCERAELQGPAGSWWCRSLRSPRWWEGTHAGRFGNGSAGRRIR
jgi:transcriptional regulator with XRE-family HTH domain